MSLRTMATLALVAAPLAAHATLVTFSTTTSDSIAVCIPGATACDSTRRISPLDFGGAPGSPSAATSASVTGFGSAQSSVALSGEIGAPIFNASTSSDSGARANTTSIALQRYTYTGTASDTRTFEALLSYSQVITGAYPNPGPVAGIFATITLFTLPVSAIDVGSTPADNFAALASLDALPGYLELGSYSFEDLSSNAAGLASFGVTVTLDPGESIWVDVALQTPATNGGFVDAAHTLISRWDNPDNLVAAFAVTEPSTAALAACALSLLLALAPCRTRRRGAGRQG